MFRAMPRPSGRPRKGGGKDICTARYCDQPAFGVGVYFKRRLCWTHVRKDKHLVCTYRSNTMEKLRIVIASEQKHSLGIEVKSLNAEIRETRQMFDALQDQLQQWRGKTMQLLEEKRKAITMRIEDTIEAEDCYQDVRDASSLQEIVDACDKVDGWIDKACERSVEFDHRRSELSKRQDLQIGDNAEIRLLGDVAGGVQQLQLSIDRQMTSVLQKSRLTNAKLVNDESAILSRSDVSDFMIDNHPKHAVFITNTCGFFVNDCNRIVAAQEADDNCTPLPECCLFILFLDIRGQASTRLLVMSFNHSVSCYCYLQTNDVPPSYGLHGDENRQLLFAALSNRSIIVTDLSGTKLQEIDLRTHCTLFHMHGNHNRLFVFDASSNRLLVFCKDTRDLKYVTQLSNLQLNAASVSFAMNSLGTKVLLYNESNLAYQLCGLSGRLISAIDFGDSIEPSSSRRVGLYDAGLIFLIDQNSDAVKVMNSNGTLLQSLQIKRDGKFFSSSLPSQPVCLCLVQEDDRKFLCVGDAADERLRVFDFFSKK